MWRFNPKLGIGSKYKKWGRRRRNRLGQAAYGRIEALERRVLMSSVSIQVQTNGDGYNDATVNSGSGTGYTYTANTLREAINFADSKSNTTTITFKSTLSGDTILLDGTFGSLQINDVGPPTIINGGTNLLTISGASVITVFNIRPGATATIDNLTITAGNAGNGDGGGIFNREGTLTLSQCTITGDSATYGGGVYNSGIATITGSTLSFCTSTYTALSGDISGRGGGIDNAATGTLTLSQCTISGDSSVYGAGVYNAGHATIGDGTISDFAISDCTALYTAPNSNIYGAGGGIYNATSGTLSVNGCTMDGDSSAGSGGGFRNKGNVTTFSYVNISNGTAGLAGLPFELDGGGGGISNNGTINGAHVNVTNCDAGSGGGIDNGGTLILTNGTISYNQVTGFGGGMKDDGNATLTSFQIQDNSANGGSAFGGGLTCGNSSANLYLANDTVMGNTTSGEGGGIRSLGTTTATGCLIQSNTAEGDGGGIDSDPGSFLALSLNNDTISSRESVDRRYNDKESHVCMKISPLVALPYAMAA